MAKGKAIEFHDLVKIAEAQRPIPFVAANLKCDVLHDGRANLILSNGAQFTLDPNDALALGTWLVDNFKTG